MRNFISMIFAPIGRWRFVLYFLILYIFRDAIPKYMSFNLNYDILTNYLFVYIALFIMFIIYSAVVYKRISDICNTRKNTVLLFILIETLIITAIGFKLANAFIPYIKEIPANPIYWYIHLVLTFLVLGFLAFKKGINSAQNLKISTVLKRATVLILLVTVIKGIDLFKVYEGMPLYTMVPTFAHLDDNALALKINKFTNLKRGDIVNTKDSNYFERIIGLPGEKIELKSDDIYINDKLLDNKYSYTNYKSSDGTEIQHQRYKKFVPLNYDETINLKDNEYLLIGDHSYIFPNMGISRYATVFEHNFDGHKYFSYYIKTSRNNLSERIIAVNYRVDYVYQNAKREKIGIYTALKENILKHNPIIIIPKEKKPKVNTNKMNNDYSSLKELPVPD